MQKFVTEDSGPEFSHLDSLVAFYPYTGYNI